MVRLALTVLTFLLAFGQLSEAAEIRCQLAVNGSVVDQVQHTIWQSEDDHNPVFDRYKQTQIKFHSTMLKSKVRLVIDLASWVAPNPEEGRIMNQVICYAIGHVDGEHLYSRFPELSDLTIEGLHRESLVVAEFLRAHAF